jgi:hypothetical protein
MLRFRFIVYLRKVNNLQWSGLNDAAKQAIFGGSQTLGASASNKSLNSSNKELAAGDKVLLELADTIGAAPANNKKPELDLMFEIFNNVLTVPLEVMKEKEYNVKNGLGLPDEDAILDAEAGLNLTSSSEEETKIRKLGAHVYESEDEDKIHVAKAHAFKTFQIMASEER